MIVVIPLKIGRLHLVIRNKFTLSLGITLLEMGMLLELVIILIFSIVILFSQMVILIIFVRILKM